MKFIEFINESESITDDLITKIKTECRDYYKQATVNKKTYQLYRGMKINKDWFVKKPHKNRTPRDTPIEIHKALDEEFKKKFGWKPRSEGVFCTGDYPESYYGNVYYIFPAGKIKFVWSPTIEDITVYLSNKDILDSYDFIILPDVTKENIDETIKNMIDTYKDDDLIAAIKSHNEISIKCNKYYAININAPNTSDLNKLYGDAWNFGVL